MKDQIVGFYRFLGNKQKVKTEEHEKTFFSGPNDLEFPESAT